MLYVEARLGAHLTAFLQWQLDQKVYSMRTFTTGGPGGFFNGVFWPEDAWKVTGWLEDHGIRFED